MDREKDNIGRYMNGSIEAWDYNEAWFGPNYTKNYYDSIESTSYIYITRTPMTKSVPTFFCRQRICPAVGRNKGLYLGDISDLTVLSTVSNLFLARLKVKQKEALV